MLENNLSNVFITPRCGNYAQNNAHYIHYVYIVTV